MKAVKKVVGAILICLAVMLVVLRFTGLDPHERVPGLWLSGDRVITPVTDWSFVAKYPTDKVETRTWYLLPHSVTTRFIVHNGQLYITSAFAAGMPFPRGKSWTTNVMRDPHVRLKFGNQLFDCNLSLVTDPAEQAAVTQETARDNLQPSASSASDGSVMHLFHVLPR